jgi:hypothetical protein
LISSNYLEEQNQTSRFDIEVVINFTFGWLNYSKMENIELNATKFRHNKYEKIFIPVQAIPTLLKTSRPISSSLFNSSRRVR